MVLWPVGPSHAQAMPGHKPNSEPKPDPRAQAGPCAQAATKGTSQAQGPSRAQSPSRAQGPSPTQGVSLPKVPSQDQCLQDPPPPGYVLYTGLGEPVSDSSRTYAPKIYQLVCEHL